MRFTKNFLARLGFLLFLSLVVANCRAAPTFSAQPSNSSSNLILWHSETDAARTELESLVRDFHTAYPELTVTPVFVGQSEDLAKQVTAAIALGRTPDLVLTTRGNLAQFARQGGLLSLDSWRADPVIGLSADDDADFLSGILNEGIISDSGKQLYAWPFDVEGLVLFYNTVLIAKPPATWNEFSEMASKATRDQQYGWAMNIDAEIFSAMLVSQGSAMLDVPERRALFAERGGVAAMTLAAQLSKAGAAKAKSAADAANDFAQGRAAFYLGWMSQWPTLQQAQKNAGANIEIGLANLPQSDPSEAYMLVRGNDLAIFKIAPERARSAWLLIYWLTAAPQTARWARAASAIPLRASAFSILANDVASNARRPQLQSSLDSAPQHFVSLPASRHTAQIESLMEEAWTQVVLNKADVAKTLTAASVRANQILVGNQ